MSKNLPKGWEEKELKFLTNKIGSGSTPKGGSNVYLENGENSLIRSQNIYNLEFSESGLVYITDEAAEKLSNVTLKEEDVLINITGDSVARVCIVPQKYLPARVNQHVSILRVNEELYSKYLQYYLVEPLMQNQLLNLSSSGATRKALTKSMLENLYIQFPKDIKEQKRIADVLSAFDDKIELNNQMNQTLESMATALFKEWFENFNFPNSEGKAYKENGGAMKSSELGEIPIDWEVNSINDIVNTFNGYSYKGKELQESNNAMVTIKNFDRNGGYKENGLKEISLSEKVKEHHFLKKNDLIIAHTDLTQGAEIIGNPIIVGEVNNYDKLIYSMDTVKVESKLKDFENEFLYYVFKSKVFKGHALGFMTGTTVLHLSKKAIPEYKIALPTNNKMVIEITNMIKPILEQIQQNQQQNQILKKQRDTLLPKLMSGEIRV